MGKMGMSASHFNCASQRPDEAKVSQWQSKKAKLLASVGFEEILRDYRREDTQFYRCAGPRCWRPEFSTQ